MSKYFKLSFGLLFFMSVVTMISCKKEFDNPPGFTEPDITANTSIKELKARHSAGNFEQITDDAIIEGVVIADDKSGNFFLNIVMQDTTGGITIRLDGNGLYTSYPIGRKVFIKCKGLYLNDYNGLIQIGGGIDNSDPTRPSLTTIASALIDSFLVKGSVGNVVTPKVVTLDQLTTSLQDPYQSTLIQLDNFEFISSQLDSTYADPENKTSVSAVNRTIKNCAGKSAILRNSSYANFAGQPVPQGNGSIVAVYSVFRTDKQFFIRDTSDVKFTGDRCTGGGGTGAPISISALRALYTGSDIELGSYKVGGIVISDASNKNISNGSVVIQSGNSGISVFMGGTISYNIGDSIVLDLTSGDSLINYRGSLEIKTQFGFVKPTPVATGKTVTPQVKTISELNSALALNPGDPGNIEFTLVKIVGATAPAGTYAGSKSLTDASGTITLYTTNTATFSGSTIPTGSIDLVGYASTFNSTKQFQIRNTTDVTGGTVTPPTGTVLLDENFESTTANADIALTGWNNIAESGGETFQAKTFNSNKYAQITAFSSGQAAVKTWLITPVLNLNTTTNEVLTFKTKDGFNNGATLKVMYSTNYDGGASPGTATWTELTATIASGTATGYAANFTNSGDVSLNTISGTTVYIAFVYEGADPGKTTTFQVDDVKVIGD